MFSINLIPNVSSSLTLLDLVVLLLATEALLAAWFKSPLFAYLKPYLEAWLASSFTKWFVAYLVQCNVCLSFHIGFWLYILYVLLPYKIGVHLITILALAGASKFIYNPEPKESKKTGYEVFLE